jgi:hypothetical protein
MIAYQMDQCANWRSLADACYAQGQSEVHRLPKRLADAEDPDVLSAAMSSGRTLLTVDRTIHYDHLAYIPNEHPGILILASSLPQRTMTEKIGTRILARFKASFPDWDCVSLRNFVVELSDVGLRIWSVRDGSLSAEGYVPFDETDWQDNVRALLPIIP